MKNLKKIIFLLSILFLTSISFSKDIDMSKVVLKDINGKEYSFNNKETYVKIWASWCPVCLYGLENIDKLSQEKNNFEVVTVVFPDLNGEKKIDDFKNWFNSLNYKNIKVLFDEKGELLKLANIRAFPTSLIVNKNNIVEKVIPGHLENYQIKTLFPNSTKVNSQEEKTIKKK